MGKVEDGQTVKKKQKEKEPDITFFHPDLFEVPEDGSPPYLKGYKCSACGELHFPKTSICPGCWGENFEIVPLSRKGKVYALTEALLGRPDATYPMAMAYVDLPENIRIFAQLEGRAQDYQCDEVVEVTKGTIRMNRDGLPITSYKFKKSNS